MVEGLPSMVLRAIGVVRNEIKQPSMRDYENVISDIVVDTNLTEALDNLEEFSHIIVFYWMDKVVTNQLPTKVHPRGNKKLPLVGLFATRSPKRPNPIGKTTVRLKKRQGNILTVAGLDATDGTPVIDIKPYLPSYDSVSEAKTPPWVLPNSSSYY